MIGPLNSLLTIRSTFERAKQEILRDVAAGIVPPYIKSFGALHAYTDPFEYGGGYDHAYSSAQDAVEFWNRLHNDLNNWIKGGMQ